MSLHQYKQELETLTLQLQFFCLDPQWSIFKKICEYPKLRNEQSTLYPIWKVAALAVNGVRWRSERGVNISGEELPTCPDELKPYAIKAAVVKFIQLQKEILNRWKRTSKAADLDRIWGMFFATGRYKYLELGFTAAVKIKNNNKLSEDAMSMYETIRNSYNEKVKALINEHPYWSEHSKIASVSDCLESLHELDIEIDRRNKRLHTAGFDPTHHNVTDLSNLIEDDFQFTDGKEEDSETEKL